MIQVDWANDGHTIIELSFQHGWTWPELHKAIQQADDLITSVTHPVNLVIDIRQAGGLPRDFMTAAGELFAQGEARPNEGRKVVVGAGVLIRAGYSAFLKIYGDKLQNRPFLFANSLEEARQVLSING